MVVPEDQGGSLLGRELLERPDQVGALGQGCGISPRYRAAQAPDQLTSLAKLVAPAVGDGDVDRDPVKPCLDRRVRPP